MSRGRRPPRPDDMKKLIAVAGGTGWIGRLVVEAARDAGHDVTVLARSTGVDLLHPGGVADALSGADVVIDVTNRNTTSAARATEFFETVTRHLLAAELPAGVAHHVLLSIVGVDRVGLGYYRAKRRQEELVAAGPVPSTILRATQFFEFAPQMLGHALGPFVPTPAMLTQPVSAREVAAELVRLAAGPPQGFATEMAGPQQLQMTDMVRRLLRARGSRRIALPVRLPGAAGRGQRDGGLLPRGETRLGRIPYDRWLHSADGRAPAPSAGVA
jgi:uncharacterized protein YbjT (DUF2867 family)